jgi:hypothetical protein
MGRGCFTRQRGPQWLLLLAVAGWCFWSSCTSSPKWLITVSFDAGIDQLHFIATASQLIFDAIRPTDAGAELQSPQTVRVEFPDSLNGQVVSLEVDGLRNRTEVASGGNQAVIEIGYDIDVPIVLTSDGGADAGSDGG